MGIQKQIKRGRTSCQKQGEDGTQEICEVEGIEFEETFLWQHKWKQSGCFLHIPTPKKSLYIKCKLNRHS